MQSTVTYDMWQNDNSSSRVSPWAFSNATLFKGYWKAKKTDTNNQVLIKSQQNWLKQGGRTIGSTIYKLINSDWNKGELPEEWKESTLTPI